MTSSIDDNRNPSPDLDENFGRNSYESTDDTVDEPWDEPPALKPTEQGQSSLLACVEEYFDPAEEEELDDGDLPKLLINRPSKYLLNGKVSTTKPLSPPSTAGLQEPERRDGAERQFWDQLEAPSASTKATNETNWDDDIPDDEKSIDSDREYLEEQQRLIQMNKPRQKDEYEVPTVDRADSIDAAQPFCDMSGMLESMCGGPGEVSSPEKSVTPPPKRRSLKSISDLPMSEEQVEEQTAIEVEYVEQAPPSKSWSAAKKNSYLSAMARKAKQNFKDTVPNVSSLASKTEDSEEKKDDTDNKSEKDFYTSLNGAEKRKFLKMVNSGMTSTEAVKTITDDREASQSKEGIRRTLAFWKKSTPKSESSRSWSRGKSRDDESRGKSIDEEDVSPVKVSIAVPESSKSGSKRSSPFSPEKVMMRPIGASRGNINGGSSESLDPSHQTSSGEDDDEDGDAVVYENTKSSNAPLIVGAVAGTAAIAASVAAITAASSKDDVSDPDIQEQLPRSGSNFYDAIRRDRDEPNKVAKIVEPKPRRMRSARMAAVKSPKLPAFSALSQKEEKDMATPVDEDSRPSSARRGRFFADARSKGAKSPDAATAKRLFTRSPSAQTGFESLDGPDSKKLIAVSKSPSENGVSSARGRDISTSAAVVGAAVVAATVNAPKSFGPVSVDESFSSDDDQNEQSNNSASDDFARLEQNLLRPTLDVTTILEDDTNDSEEEEDGFDIVTPLSMKLSPQSKAIHVSSDVDVNLGNYLESATTYSSVMDGMSVVSGKSHWTAATGATNCTTSSRVRRPGAAKVRLANAKEADRYAVSKKGWHETIKAAAAKSNHKWDPKDGFPEFKDSDSDIIDTPSDDALRIQLKGMKKRPSTENSDIHVVNNVAERAFDIIEEDMEDESHLDMELVSGDDVSRHEEEDEEQLDEEDEEQLDEEDEEQLDEEDEEQLDGDDVPIMEEPASKHIASSMMRAVSPQVQSSNTPPPVAVDKGWLESMNLASAKIPKENIGPTWDPENGWQGLEAEDPPPSAIRAQAPDPDGVFPAIVPGGYLIAGAAPVAVSYIPDKGRSLEYTFNDESPAAASLSLPIAPSVDTGSIVSRETTNEKYVQLGDTGSVRSFVYDQSPTDASDKKSSSPAAESLSLENEAILDDSVHSGPEIFEDSLESEPLDEESISEDDRAPLLASGVTFVRSNAERGPAVNVVKEKNSEKDIDLFAHDSRTSLSKVRTPPTIENGSKRRGNGPVDVDEIDDMEDFDDADDDSLWVPEKMTILTKKNKGPLPKLDAPKKDTSPIRDQSDPAGIVNVRQKSIRATQVSNKTGDPDGTRTIRTNSVRVTGSPVNLKPEPVNLKPEPVRNNDTVRTDHHESHVKSLAKQWESRSVGSPSPPLSPYAHRSPGASYSQRSPASPYAQRFPISPYAQRSPVSPYPQRSPIGSSYVSTKKAKDELDAVVMEVEKAHDRGLARRANDEAPAGTAEWKSFLGKKVEAESAAATTREVAQRTKRDPSEENYAKDPKDPNDSTLNEEDEDEDSLFEFHPSLADQTGAFPTARPQELDNFSNLSPIRAEDERYDYDDETEDYDDAHHNDESHDYDSSRDQSMEAVSDTGTNIEQGTFFKRLQACAAPMMPRQFTQVNDNGETEISAHLAFMRSNAQAVGSRPAKSGRFAPPDLCGRPETIAEDADEALTTPRGQINAEARRSTCGKRTKQRASPKQVSSGGSVISDDGFGARTSYLEAVAMRAAVSKPTKRHGSRGRAGDEKSSSRSDVSVSSSKRHGSRGRASDDRSSARSDVSIGSRTSERWQEFLDRKAAGVSPGNQRSPASAISPSNRSDISSENVSKASEIYAAQQVDKMIEAMSRNRSKGAESGGMNSSSVMSPSSRGSALLPYELNQVRSEGSKSTRSVKKKNESALAAEELAAARVEAMMAAMTSQTLDEGEI